MVIRIIEGEAKGNVLPLNEFLAVNEFEDDYAAEIRGALDIESEVDQTQGRALHNCDVCGLDFAGPTGGSDFANHVCIPRAVRERIKREEDARRAQNDQIETALCQAFEAAIERFGFQRAIEALANATEQVGERDDINADCWTERAAVMFELTGVGHERDIENEGDYGGLNR